VRWLTVWKTLPPALNDNDLVTEHVLAEIKNLSFLVANNIRRRCGDSDFGAV